MIEETLGRPLFLMKMMKIDRFLVYGNVKKHDYMRFLGIMHPNTLISPIKKIDKMVENYFFLGLKSGLFGQVEGQRVKKGRF